MADPTPAYATVDNLKRYLSDQGLCQASGSKTTTPNTIVLNADLYTAEIRINKATVKNGGTVPIVFVSGDTLHQYLGDLAARLALKGIYARAEMSGTDVPPIIQSILKNAEDDLLEIEKGTAWFLTSGTTGIAVNDRLEGNFAGFGSIGVLDETYVNDNPWDSILP